MQHEQLNSISPARGVGYNGIIACAQRLVHRVGRGLMKCAVLCSLFLVCSVLPCLGSRSITDETGRAVTVPDHPHRIICLVPNVTDDVFALGAGADVVAISDFVEYPAAAKSKPSVGTITDPSIEKIVSLHPDLVLGMPHANNQATLDRLKTLGIPVYLADPHGVDGILHTLTDLGHAIGRDREAQATVARLTLRIDAVRASVKGKSVVSVFLPVSHDPVITIGKGSYITELIALAGGRSVTDDIRQEWPQISMETVISRAPEALLLLREGDITVAGLRKMPGWSQLPAVRTGRAYLYDRRLDFPSPISIDALEDLARQFHP
jgi:ABC-type Fe3+-hydroxamate transport system substrate-binding protein